MQVKDNKNLEPILEKETDQSLEKYIRVQNPTSSTNSDNYSLVKEILLLTTLKDFDGGFEPFNMKWTYSRCRINESITELDDTTNK